MIHTISDKVIVVEIPNDARDFGLTDLPQLVFSSRIQDPLHCGGDMIRLPPGNYTIIGRGSEISEEQAKDMVDKISPYRKKICYCDYEGSSDEWLDMGDWFDTALESLASWFKSKSLNPKNTIILKRY